MLGIYIYIYRIIKINGLFELFSYNTGGDGVIAVVIMIMAMILIDIDLEKSKTCFRQ
tara:strand:+ start:264 stop:434 length:171 start_codon:yes stop_codon:yes gene_type:complete